MSTGEIGGAKRPDLEAETSASPVAPSASAKWISTAAMCWVFPRRRCLGFILRVATLLEDSARHDKGDNAFRHVDRSGGAAKQCRNAFCHVDRSGGDAEQRRNAAETSASPVAPSASPKWISSATMCWVFPHPLSCRPEWRRCGAAPKRLLSCRPEWGRCEAAPKRSGDICKPSSTFCITEMDFQCDNVGGFPPLVMSTGVEAMRSSAETPFVMSTGVGAMRSSAETPFVMSMRRREAAPKRSGDICKPSSTFCISEMDFHRGTVLGFPRRRCLGFILGVATLLEDSARHDKGGQRISSCRLEWRRCEAVPKRSRRHLQAP